MSQAFLYEARGRGGRTERGRIEASDRDDALSRLRGRGLTPLDLRNAPAQRRGALRDADARDLARSLAQLLRSGLTFAQALRFAGEELDGAPARIAMRLREAVDRGERASSGLRDEPGAPARLLSGVLLAGEASGLLADALEVAAQVFARSADLRARLQSALIYPCFVLAATGVTLLIFVLFVTPSLALAFDGRLEGLPPTTRALLDVSAWLRESGVVLALSLFAAALATWSSGSARKAIAHLWERLSFSPLGGGIAPRLEFATFARLSGMALGAGVPAAAAFEAAASGLSGDGIRAKLSRAVADVRTGERPSIALARAAAPPRTLVRLVQLGEESGKLAASLAHAADLLSAEAEQRLARAGALAGPLMTLGLGGLVASVVLSLFLGLLSLSDMAVAP